LYSGYFIVYFLSCILTAVQQQTDNTQKAIAAIICAHQLSDGLALALFKEHRYQLFRKIVYASDPSVECLTNYINEAHIHHFVTLCLL
jgi:DNA-binding FadR family transcriptional regulator